MNDGETTETAAARRGSDSACDPRAHFKSVKCKISVVVSPPRDGSPANARENRERREDAKKGLLRRFSIRGGGSGGAGGRGGGAGVAGEESKGGGLDAARQVDEMMRAQNTRLQEKIKRQARTHSLLVSIVVVFALSWFPLNVLNIVLDVKGDIFRVRTDIPTRLSN